MSLPDGHGLSDALPPLDLRERVFSLERELRRKTSIAIEYTRLWGVDLFRVRDLNAPLPGTVVRPDAAFPDYSLTDHTGTVRSLSELQGDDPLILTLARGHYCPKEHQQHLEIAANWPKIAVAYTQVVTIATDEHHTLQEFRASVGA